MMSLKLSIYCTVSILLAAHNAFAGETAIIDGLEITVSGSEEAEERFKRYAEAKAKKREAKVEDEFRLRTKMDSANLGPLKSYVMGRFHHGFDWTEFRQYEHMDTAPLFELLEDPDWSPYWGQTLGVIGAIADKEGAKKLLSYILRDDPENNLHTSAKRVKTDAIAALGRTVIRGVYPEGMSFLEAHVMPSDWKKTLARLDISDRKAQELHRRTILVVSAIGTEEAVEILMDTREKMAEEYFKEHQEVGAEQNLKKHLRLIDLYIENAKRGPKEERTRDS